MKITLLRNPLPRVHVLLTAILFCGLHFSVYAQDKLEKTLHTDAVMQMEMGKFEQAIETYNKILKINSKNPRYFYELGVAYYMSPKDKEYAARSFQQAVKYSAENDTIEELFYYYGKALQWNHDFKAAINAYERFLPGIKNNKAGEKLREEVEWEIKRCKHGMYHVRLNTKNPLENNDKPLNNTKKYYTNSTDYLVFTNLGNIINSSQDDYAPIFFKNGNELIFTSRRIDPTSTEPTFYDQLPYERIFVSRSVGGRWKAPFRASSSNMFGTNLSEPDAHLSNTALANGETELYIVSNNTLNVSVQTAPGQWSDMQALGENINVKKGKISSCYVSDDGKTMIIAASLKDEGFGNYDLYISEKQADGTWGKMVNLGAVINTKHNEVSPFMEDNVLYFASEGHSSIGGYDIFFSVKESNGVWSNPRNLGIPINTPADELYYQKSKTNSKEAYYASGRKDGYGNLDIYSIQAHSDDVARDELALALGGDFEFDETGKPIVESDEPIAAAEEPKEPTTDGEEIAAAETGTSQDEEKEDASGDNTESTEETSENSGQEETVSETESETGDEIAAAESTASNEPEEDNSSSSEESTTTTPTPTEPKTTIDEDVKDLLANIEFGFNGNQLNQAQKDQVQRIKKYLDNNPNYIIHLEGHSDYIGSEDVNMQVSKRRALLVFNELVKDGADPMRVTYDYKGESEPLVKATTADGDDIPENRAKNRRVELGVEKLALFRYVTFGFDADQLSAEAKKTLDQVAEFIKNNSVSIVELNGFTDNVGNVSYNKALSERRAKSALDYLASKGVDKSKIKVSSFGQDNPATPHNQSLNRRVEIKVQN